MTQFDKSLEVTFRCQATGEIIGNLVSDPRPTPHGDRTKIVLIYGYKKEAAEKWEKPLPQTGETWKCEEMRDTKSGDPHSGAILVRLVENLSLRFEQDKERRRVVLAPIYSSLEDLSRLIEESLAQESIDILAQTLRALAEDAAIRLGFAEAIKVFLHASGSTLPELRSLAKEKDPALATHPAWRTIEDLGQNGRVHKCCFEAVLAWLAKLRAAGELPTRKFVFSYDRFFQCPGCSAKVRLKPTEWDDFTSDKEISMECPVCNTVGVATK